MTNHAYVSQKQAMANLENALRDDAGEEKPQSGCDASCCFAAAALFGWVGVAAGAFGAHALKSKLSDKMYEAYETGVRYQFYHIAALLACSALLVIVPEGSRPRCQLQWAGRLFIVSTILFSGSLYALAITGVDMIGVITPVGGVGFLIAWGLLGVGGSKALAAVDRGELQGALSPITPGIHRTPYQGPVQVATPPKSSGYANPEFQAIA